MIKPNDSGNNPEWWVRLQERLRGLTEEELPSNGRTLPVSVVVVVAEASFAVVVAEGEEASVLPTLTRILILALIMVTTITIAASQYLAQT
jgi:hypothetical protein